MHKEAYHCVQRGTPLCMEMVTRVHGEGHLNAQTGLIPLCTERDTTVHGDGYQGAWRGTPQCTDRVNTTVHRVRHHCALCLKY